MLRAHILQAERTKKINSITKKRDNSDENRNGKNRIGLQHEPI